MSWIKNTTNMVDDISLTKLKQRQFGVLLLTFLVLICSVSIYKEGLSFNSKQLYVTVSAGIVLLITFLLPVLFYPFLFIWLFLGNILGEISSFIILGIVYYLLFFPITFILKMMHKEKAVKGWINRENSIDYEKLY